MFQSKFVTESYFSPGFEIHIVQFYIYVCVYIYIYTQWHQHLYCFEKYFNFNFDMLLVSVFCFFFFLLFSCTSFLCILDINPLWGVWFGNIFSHSIGYPFLCFCCADFLVWCTPTYFCFVICAFSVVSKKSLLRTASGNFYLLFSSSSFIISVLIFQS